MQRRAFCDRQWKLTLSARLCVPLSAVVPGGFALVEAHFRGWARRFIVAWRMVGTQQKRGYKCHCIDSHPARPASGCSVEMFVLFAAVWKAVGRVTGIQRTCVSVRSDCCFAEAGCIMSRSVSRRVCIHGVQGKVGEVARVLNHVRSHTEYAADFCAGVTRVLRGFARVGAQPPRRVSLAPALSSLPAGMRQRVQGLRR